MQLLKALHQLIAFLLEIAMLITLGMWGFHGTKSTMAKLLPGLGLPILAAVLWGILAAPKSTYRLDLPYRLLFSFTLFSIASLLLHRLGHTTLAILFIVLAIVSTLLEVVFD